MRAIALLAALALAPPLAAQDPGNGVPSMARHYMERVDADGDGHVSLAEYQDWMGYAFSRMDRDGNGILAAAELPGGKGEPVTLEAHRARLAARFQRQDRNGDGHLDAVELTAPPR